MDLETRVSLSKHRIFMGDESFEACKDNFRKSRYNRAVDDIYYACFNLTRACLILVKGEDYSDHGKCIGEFNKFFVNETKEASRITGSSLHILARERNRKTYKETVPVQKEEAEEIINLGEDVYGEIKSYYDAKLQEYGI